MGSRGRSIRLRIYFLVAIPLIAMAGLLAYVVTTTVYNAVSLDRARGPTSAATRAAISPAALLVKVMARIWCGETSRAASR